MPENKTVFTDEDVRAFVGNVESAQKRTDSYRLIELMETVSGEKARMFGTAIIGFGKYHYKYASGHEGDAPLIGFSPRKAAISLYVYTGADEHAPLLKDLGRFTMGKACIYVKKLSDINEAVLVKLMKATITYIAAKYTRL